MKALSLYFWLVPVTLLLGQMPQDVDVLKVDQAFGLQLWKDNSDQSLWNEDETEVAHRLYWPAEGRTQTQASYRFYPTEKYPLSILGARAYSCALYTQNGKPTEISLVFINPGDYTASAPEVATAASTTNAAPADDPLSGLKLDDKPTAPTLPPPPPPMVADSLEAGLSPDYVKALKHDTDTIQSSLTSLLGDPSRQAYGVGEGTSEKVWRWDWQGHSILLATPHDQYVIVRIVPKAVADNDGRVQPTPYDEFRKIMAARVAQTAWGDVNIKEIPMVNQGPKGYCVPATWERYLRYIGIPADMYVLAMAAGTSKDQGTSIPAIVAAVSDLVQTYHQRIVTLDSLDMKTVSAQIDAGLPIMWTCTIYGDLEKEITHRTEARVRNTDWNAWAEKAKGWSANPSRYLSNPLGGHQRMITGYNAKTQEVCISDSWGEWAERRWMTLAEVNAIRTGSPIIIKP